MRRFFKNVRGTVSIMVSMMLIPALLLSGTAVDVARIHSSRSTAQNVNQLIGNTVMTQYDALLKDLYGLFGVAQTNPILGELINQYIEISFFGQRSDENRIPTGLGTFQMYDGSEISSSVEPADGFNLRNTDVLRRQIEEYMKFRGPVLIVERLLAAFDVQGSSLRASSEVIEQQERINEGLSELFRLYEQLYRAILRADRIRESAGPWNVNIAGAVTGVGGFANIAQGANVSGKLEQIRAAFDDLAALYALWESVGEQIEELEEELDDGETELTRRPFLENEIGILGLLRADIERAYNAKLRHIAAIATGSTWQDWRIGEIVYRRNAAGIIYTFEDGSAERVWRSAEHNPIPGSGGMSYIGLAQVIENAREIANNFSDVIFQNVVDIARQIDSKRNELYDELNELKRRLEDPNVDENLKNALTAQIPNPEPGAYPSYFPSTIDSLDELINRFPNITGLAQSYVDEGNRYISINVNQDTLGAIRYRNRNNPSAGGGGLTIDALRNIAANPDFALNENISASASRAAVFAGFEPRYDMPGGFIPFRDIAGNRELYDLLRGMSEASGFDGPVLIPGIADASSGGDDPEARQRGILDSLVSLAETARDGLSPNPRGALSVTDPHTTSAPTARENVQSSRVISFISNPADALQSAASYVLILTYAAGMFTSYTTHRPAHLIGNGLATQSSISGVALRPEVNYFYQSELEYLLMGNLSAKANLNAVSYLIFAIRMICNMITVFQIDEIVKLAATIKKVMLPIPFVGPALGVVLYFATFAAFAAAESAYDIIRLRTGCRIPLIKNSDQWRMQLSTVVEVLENLSDGGFDHSIDAHNEESGISYMDYLTVFFLAGGPNTDTLVHRIGNLIEWNVTNYRDSVNANNMVNNQARDAAASAMSAARANPDAFRLSRYFTDFNMTTTIDLRLMFLPMPFFESQGSPFENRIPITAVDFRGY